jgi:hypothetical protein
MALVTISSAARVDASSAQFAPQVSGDYTAGEALLACAPCYIKASDGLVYMSNGTAANEAAGCDGFTPRSYLIGEGGVTLYGPGTKFEYATGMAIGKLYIGATAGRLDTAATTGDTTGVAKAITPRIIQVRNYK